MTKIIIPTYNRSAKLARTLHCYHCFEAGFIPDIIVLDGSDKVYMEKNRQICDMYPTVEYSAAPGSGFMARLIEYLKNHGGDLPVCLGTDEDVFLPDYITRATDFLNGNPEYSMLLGRYLTFLRPVGPFNRMSHNRDVITSFDINQDDIGRRISLLAFAVSTGCAPVFWGIRRSDQLLLSLMYQERLHFQSSQEIVDQIIVAYQGKIRFSDFPMLLRDETNIEYVYTEDRHDDFNYFPPSEYQLISEILNEVGGQSLSHAGNIYLDRYLLDYVAPGSPCLEVQSHNKSYTKYEPIQMTGKNLMYKAVFIIMKSVMILTEILTAFRDLKVLKRMYNSSVLTSFTRRIRSNQVS